MKTAEEWYAHQGQWGDPEEFTELVRAIQADAIEAAAKLCELEENRRSAGWLLAHKIREMPQ